jgi:hypothetical protein
MTLGLQANFNYETKARDHIAGEKKDEGILMSWYAVRELFSHLGRTLARRRTSTFH